MEVMWIADIKPEAGKNVYMQAGYPEENIIFADSVSEATRLAQDGKRVVLQDGLLLPLLPADVLCDVTGDPLFGAQYAYNAIMQRKHVVAVNIESDSGVGAVLRRKADENKVVYTEADGDQPSLIKGMFDWASCLGLEIETLGKWICQKPCQETRPYNRVSEGFLDGSKNQVEMCCVANMTGFLPDVRGMHMPTVALTDIPDVLCGKDCGGIFSGNRIIEVVNCYNAVEKKEDRYLHGGVFIIIRANHDVLQKVINSKGFIVSKDGQRAILFRPFHFVGIETPISILRAALFGEPTASPLQVPVADVIALAKRDLYPGDMLDGIGGQTVRGVVERRDTAKKEGLMPLILTDNVRVSAPVKRGQTLTYDSIEKPKNSFIWKLRQTQDEF